MTNKHQKVCFIGSMTCSDAIKYIAEKYEQSGYCVKYVKPRPEVPLESLIEDAFDMIDWSDVVIPVPKKDGSFGNGTLYEIAYAKRKGKIVIYE